MPMQTWPGPEPPDPFDWKVQVGMVHPFFGPEREGEMVSFNFNICV